MGEDSSRYVTLSEVKELISKEAEKRELTYEQSLALSHAEKFTDISGEDSVKLVEELKEKFDFLNEKLAYKMADILPLDEDGVKAVFSKDRYTPSQEDCEAIINVIKEYL